MKKAQDKFNAAEKIRRDKWIDAKTKKIKVSYTNLFCSFEETILKALTIMHADEFKFIYTFQSLYKMYIM